MREFIKIIFLTVSFSASSILSAYAQLVSDFKVNDDTTNTEQFSAKIGVDNYGIVSAVWRDQRNGKPNIYCQRFNTNGVFIGKNFRINMNPDSSGSPAVAVSKNGNFGVCWVEINGTINNSSRVKFRLFDINSMPLTGEIVLNDTNGNFSGPLSISVSPFDEFIVTWEQKNILFQMLDSLGTKKGNNKIANDDNMNINHRFPSITLRQDGSFIITWNDTRPPSQPNNDDIYMQMFDKLGNKLGVNQRVNDDFDPINFQGNPKLSSDNSGNFVIGWSDGRLNLAHTEVYAQRYNFDGSKIGQNFRVTQSSTQNGKGIGGVYMKPEGKFIIGWSEFRPNIPQCYFQRYDADGNRLGNNFLVSDQSLNTGKYYSDVTIFNDKVISVWSDVRYGPLDIYCNIRSFTNPDTTVNIVQISSIIPDCFTLHQNYPNPFNNSTQISFEIINNDYYNLSIYNVLGKKIKELFDKNLSAGSYKINFQSESLSSGTYHYILSSPKERIVKSFVLLK